MFEQSHFQDQFLVAMPQQGDHIFSEALIYICEHNNEGAMGLIVNKPLPIELHALAKHLGLETGATKYLENFKDRVFFGGPCDSNHGFILHDGGLHWPASIQVNDRLTISSSKDILADIALTQGPEHFLLTLGYAGWEAGQLEAEMSNNVWLNVNADFDILFSLAPEQRWQHAAQLIGIDIQLLTQQVGFD